MSFDPRGHLIKLKGKDYLEVKWRMVWLDQETKRFRIRTQVVPTPPGAKGVTVSAEVELLSDAGELVRSATAHKTSTGFPGGDLEKAETGAIGRALALLGFGTQFAVEFEVDGDEPVDSPVESKPTAPPMQRASNLPPPTNKNKPQNQPQADPNKLLAELIAKLGATDGGQKALAQAGVDSKTDLDALTIEEKRETYGVLRSALGELNKAAKA